MLEITIVVHLKWFKMVLDNPISDEIRGITLVEQTTVTAIINSALGDRITDSDAGAIEGIAVISADDTNGTWQYSTNSGGTWTSFGAVSNTNTVLLDTTALIRYLPSSNYNGSAEDITFRAWDQTSDNNGATGVDLSNNGGFTAFSANTETATLNLSS